MRDTVSEEPDPDARPGARAPEAAWTDARRIAQILAVDPAGLGGTVLRARAGPARDAWLALLQRLTPGREVRRVPANARDDQLLGGLDLAATLDAGRQVRTRGTLALAAGGTLILAMAERTTPGVAARITAAHDAGAGFMLIALDEGAEPDERAPTGLRDRLAFAPDLAGVSQAMLRTDMAPNAAEIAQARTRLARVRTPGGLCQSMVETAAAFGIGSLRAPMLALRAARALAALEGRRMVGEADAADAARLVLAPRATRLPEAEPGPEDPHPPEPPPDASIDPEDRPRDDAASQRIPDDVLLDAVRAALPADLLARLMTAGSQRRAGGASQAGGDARSGKGGRPVGARPGALRQGARLDLIDTLRAAAPWQPLRRRNNAAPDGRVLVRPEDFRLKRFKRRAERVVIFVVDASGSTALGRLAEAKGAIELMLAQAYVARQQVALIAFRGTRADVLLPPTRSLVATKRRLARLPGGGGTPLAAGLEAALAMACQARARDVTPYLAILTDGRANVARDGSPGRPQAATDAQTAARAVRAAGIRSVVIDTSDRPSPPARDLALALGGTCLPLPRADARALSGAMRAALDASA